MGVIEAIHRQLTLEKQNGNPLIGEIAFTTLPPGQTSLSECYVKAHEIFPAAKALIESAVSLESGSESEVLISLYKIQGNSYGAKQILEALTTLKNKAEQQRKNITVKIVLNNKIGLASLVKGGGRKSSLSVENLLALNSFSNFHIEIAHHNHPHFGSNHAKTIIVDGNGTMFLSGDPTLRNEESPEKSWLETGVICTNGEISQSARQHFVAMWNSDRVVAIDGSTKTQLQAKPASQATSSLDIENDNDNENSEKLLFLGKNRYCGPCPSDFSPYKAAFIKLLDAAKKSINIVVNNINDPDILKKFIECAKRDVKINLVVGRYHGETAESLPFGGGTNLDSLNYILKNTPPSFHKNLNLRWALSNETGHLVQNMEDKTIHAKMLIVDKRYILTGSSLLDKQSLRSRETDLLIDSKNKADEFNKKLFAPLLKEDRSRHISVKNLRTRGEIKECIIMAQSLTELQYALNQYIFLREYEGAYTSTTRHVISFFSDQKHRQRASKISAAIALKESLSAPNHSQVQDHQAFHDGLLKIAYEKANDLLGENHSPTSKMAKC